MECGCGRTKSICVCIRMATPHHNMKLDDFESVVAVMRERAALEHTVAVSTRIMSQQQHQPNACRIDGHFHFPNGRDLWPKHILYVRWWSKWIRIFSLLHSGLCLGSISRWISNSCWWWHLLLVLIQRDSVLGGKGQGISVYLFEPRSTPECIYGP